MDFLSLEFFAFLIFFLIIYYIVKTQYRYIVIFIGSYIFYAWYNPRVLVVLGGVTLISYIGGVIIEHKKYKAVYLTFMIFELSILFFFKYMDFILKNYSYIMSFLRGTESRIAWSEDIILPIGLSFIVFQVCTYLSDVYRDRIKAERNVIRLGAFCAFFPTVMSGPIQKARDLIPQIRNPQLFNFDEARKGTLLFVWGAFEKIMVANRLKTIYTPILKYYQNYTSAHLLIAVVSFSVYIYADFSSYSDMARGIAKFLGIDVGKNFRNPYLSKNTSEFWNKWHISLYEWFKEIIYFPLGGNKRGTCRKYINIMVVFLLSGLWHGAEWHFLMWGLLNGLMVISGQILKPIKTSLYQKINMNEDSESIVLIKKVLSFCLITLTWVFFACGIRDSVRIIKRVLLFDFISLFNPELLNISGTTIGTVITVAMILMFIRVQVMRQNESGAYLIYKKQPLVMQCLPVAILICVCIFGASATDVSADTQFLYFNF